MVHKLLLIAAVTAMPLGVIAATGDSVSAATPGKVNATNDTVICQRVTASVTFSPTVTSRQPAGTTIATIEAKLTGCTSNAVGLTVTSGTVSGSVSDTHGVEDGCTSLAGPLGDPSLIPVIGTLITKWKTSPMLSSGNSVTTIQDVEGSVAGDGLVKFDIPGTGGTGSSGTGSFSGTDGGASTVFSVLTQSSATSILSACNSTGLTSVTIDHARKGPNTNPLAAFFG
jgi:hypothetical protein